MLPERADPFVDLPSAEKRRLVAATVLLVLVWLVATAAFLVTLDNVLGPMEHPIVKLDKFPGRG